MIYIKSFLLTIFWIIVISCLSVVVIAILKFLETVLGEDYILYLIGLWVFGLIWYFVHDVISSKS